MTGTVVHLPELDIVISDDIAYEVIHMWQWGSTPASSAADLGNPYTAGSVSDEAVPPVAPNEPREQSATTERQSGTP